MIIFGMRNKNKQTYFLNILLTLSVSAACLVGVDLFCYSYLNIPPHMPPLVYFELSEKPPKRLKRNADIVALGPYREFRYRITTDSYGFRRTYPFKNNEGIYSLAILGDSQSFGVGIEDEKTFASLLAKNLGVSVLNAACPGHNTIEEFWTYQNRIQPFKPRHVLLFFFSGNDPYENYKNRDLYYGDSRNQPLLQNQQDFPVPTFFENLKDFLSKHSAIYTSLIQLRQYPQLNRFLYRYKLVNTTPPPELAIFKKDQNRKARAHWQITEQILSNLRDKVEANGSKFWIVFIPDRYQLDNAYWQQWVSKYNLEPRDFDLTLPNRHLAAFSRKNGISFLDTTESLIKIRDQGKNVYWKIDAHLNGLGHKVIADFVASHLAKQAESITGKN